MPLDLHGRGCRHPQHQPYRHGGSRSRDSSEGHHFSLFNDCAGVFVPHRVRTCRRELLDRTLIWNQRHLLHALGEFEIFYNEHRPHQGIANARPLAPLPEPITDPDRIADLNIYRRDRLGGVLHEYEHAA
jgi:hypothetical protein